MATTNSYYCSAHPYLNSLWPVADSIVEYVVLYSLISEFVFQSIKYVEEMRTKAAEDSNVIMMKDQNQKISFFQMLFNCKKLNQNPKSLSFSSF